MLQHHTDISLSYTVTELKYMRYSAAFCGITMIIYGLYLALFSLVGFPTEMASSNYMPFLSDKPVGEDGYYMLLIAWNLASGAGFVGNFGEITTGVQPLSVFIFSGVAKLVQFFGGNKFDFVRAIIILGTVNILIFGHVVGKISENLLLTRDLGKAAYYFAFSIACLSFYFFRIFTYGLETGLYLTSFAFSIKYSLRLARSSRSSAFEDVGLGLLIGLTGLFRIDFGIVAATFFACLILIDRWRLTSVLTIGITALLLTAPWFLWVHSVSGSWVPSSGPAQSAIVDYHSAISRISSMAKAFIQNISMWIFTGSRLEPTLFALSGVIVLVIYSFLRKAQECLVCPSKARVFSYWALSLALLIPVYTVWFWAAHFYARYTAPISVVSLIFVSVLFVQTRSIAAFISVLSIVFVSNAAFAFISLHTGQIGNSHSVTAGYVLNDLPSSARVGAFQSGVIGYFNTNVVNLDGKINSAALRALKENKLPAYLSRDGIAYIVDWGDTERGTINGIPSDEWKLCPKPIPNNASVCLVRRSHSPSP